MLLLITAFVLYWYFLLIPAMIPYLGKGSLWTGISQGSSNDIILLFWVFFLGHPKYPNTVDADWKAHKEDMMHRPKWRGYIRTL